MKISKRSNGSYVLRVSQVEATISGPQTIKEVYELYEKLIRLVGDGQELKKIEPSKAPKVEEATVEEEKEPTTYDVRFPEPPPVDEVPVKSEGKSRPEMIIEVLKEHGPMLALALVEKTGLTTTQLHGALPNCIKTKRIKRKKSSEGYVYSVPN
jgi:hypothetical protein